MAALVALLSTVLLSLIISRIAAVALTFTGMSREMAGFQARSAFSTTGFTTSESESVVNHPVRRRIIALLMLFGNAGLVVVIATGIVTFSSSSTIPLASRICLLVAGLALLWVLGTSKWIDDHIFRVTGWALRRFTYVEVHDFLDLLHVGQGYNVTKMPIDETDWLVGQRLDGLRLSLMGVLVLGVRRANGELVGNPTGATYIRRGDNLILYGAREDIVALDRWKGGEEGKAEYMQRLEERRVAHDLARIQEDERARQEGERTKKSPV
ncbi:MAG: potassium transporter TrkA [Candidatus Hydrogenedentes bacterium]|nr:potassium transporter TrkA [Candidatus Hydrogenedentota bacterium]